MHLPSRFTWLAVLALCSACPQSLVQFADADACAGKSDGTDCATGRVCKDGVCVACGGGSACSTNGNPCRKGMVSCSTGSPVCTDSTVSQPVGSSCGSGKVCSASGACVDCVEQMRCDAPATSCFFGALSCGDGSPQCMPSTIARDAGASCGTDRVCDGKGVCVDCATNSACTDNPSGACVRGTVVCTTGAKVCVDAEPLDAGVSCGSDRVCSGTGQCVSCALGTQCSDHDGGTCRTGAIACSSGAPVCLTSGAAPAGNACGTGKVCDGLGACVDCSNGSACATNDGGVCVRGVLACGSGTPVCNNSIAVDAGAACGLDLVCDGAGACVACAQTSLCTTNPSGSCVFGRTDCSTGTPVCHDDVPRAAGSSCGTNAVCTGDGGCVSCTPNQSCSNNPGGTCLTGRIACNTGTARCLDSSPVAAGLTCGTDRVCSGDGGCISCVVDAGCTPGTNECIGGAIVCGSGAPVCVSTGPKREGTSCTTGSCSQGNCVPDVTVATNTNLSVTPVSAGRTCSDVIAYNVVSLSATGATLSTAPAAGCLAPGDEMLLINLQGVPTSFQNVGNWELVNLASIAGSTVTFTNSKRRNYGADAGSDDTIGTAATQQKVVLQRVPRFGTFTVNAGVRVTSKGWDGTSGGVLALRAGKMIVNGAIEAKTGGYRSGAYSDGSGDCATSIDTEAGESISGLGAVTTNVNVGGSGGLCCDYTTLFHGSFTAGSPHTSGAAHATAGSVGQNPLGRTIGPPGVTYGVADAGKLTMGSGYGGMLTCHPGGGTYLGGRFSLAGGIILLLVGELTVNAGGMITASTEATTQSSAGYVALRVHTASFPDGGIQALSGMTPTFNVQGGNGYVSIMYRDSVSGISAPPAFQVQAPSPLVVP